MARALGCVLAAALASIVASAPADLALPLPFKRVLQYNDTGADVYIAQNLLRRFARDVSVTSVFDTATVSGVAQLQENKGLNISGKLDAATATALLACCSRDGYVDDGRPPAELGYMYKVHLQVYANRSREVTARFLAGNGSLLLSFVARAHGGDVGVNASWPYYSNCCDGLNEFSDDGNTPTGLAEFDLNTPEGNPVPYGPWPVNRLVKGLAGNAAWLVTNDAATTIRDGILLHTGQWSNHSAFPWAPPMSMPNSAGCIHAWPQNIELIQDILINHLGVQARPNTDGALPYPYKPQGLLSVEQLD